MKTNLVDLALSIPQKVCYSKYACYWFLTLLYPAKFLLSTKRHLRVVSNSYVGYDVDELNLLLYLKGRNAGDDSIAVKLLFFRSLT